MFMDANTIQVSGDKPKFKSSTNIFNRFIKQPKPGDNIRRNNANINSDNPMGAMLQFGSALSKEEYLKDIPEKYARAHIAGYIHIHDLDFYDLTTTCCQISLDKLFQTGFGNMRPPKRIQSAFMQLCIAIQSNQNDQYGGQSIVDYDIALPKLIAQCYRRNLEKWAELPVTINREERVRYLTIEEVEQGCESMIHNLNTMNSRAGAQVPFSSINYGLGMAYFHEMGMMEEEYWARILLMSTWKATLRGLAHGETPRYPIQIYRVKKGINALPSDPYYHDFTELALECTAKRAYPNYIFIDNANNDKGFDLTKPETHVATMGCRTRVFADMFGESTSYGRGNASFCTINLPRLGILAKDKSEFFSRLHYTIDLVADQLQYRLTRQCKRNWRGYPSLVGDEMGIGADKCKETNDMWPMLKHFSLGIGFIGLYECLNALKIKNIECTGLEIVNYMKFRTEKHKAIRKLNYSLLATPAERVCERFLNLDRCKFGPILNVTDKAYYTNSFHIPVDHEIDIITKLQYEAQYHILCDGGHISYAELDGDVSQNPEVMKSVFSVMLYSGIGYGAFNVPLDHCLDCHHDGYIPTDSACPECGSTHIQRLRRITGYLAYLENFNDGKKSEERHRVKHKIPGFLPGIPIIDPDDA